MKRALAVLAAVLLGVGIWFLTRASEPAPDTADARISGGSEADSRVASEDRDARAPTTPPTTRATPDATTPPPDAPMRGGMLKGRVLDALGEPHPGVALTLVDAAGKTVAQATSGEAGGYHLLDPDLLGRGISLAGAPQALDPPLARGEIRQLDVFVGTTREVVGFVLDASGAPIVGVPVTLQAVDFSARQSALSNARGVVTFRTAPVAALRLEADGAERGSDAAFVAAGPRRASVDLVLEPTAELTVTLAAVSGTIAGAEVLVRNYNVLAYGPERGWREGAADPLEERNARTRVIMTTQALMPELMPAGADTMTLTELQAALQAAQDRLTPEQADAIAARRTDQRVADLNAALARLPQPAPSPDSPSAFDRRAVIARGPSGTTFRLAADFTYSLGWIDDTGYHACGNIPLAAGDERQVTCGRGQATLEGRVVDASGQPLAGGQIRIFAPGPKDFGTFSLDERGRFSANLSIDGVESVGVQVVQREREDIVDFVRSDVRLEPGDRRDLGTLVHRSPSDAYPPMEPHSGVGGRMGFAETGFEVMAFERDSPLELSGVEQHDTIIGVDGEPVSGLSIPELLDRLRGDEGTTIDLRIRTWEGELYEVTLERGLIMPSSLTGNPAAYGPE